MRSEQYGGGRWNDVRRHHSGAGNQQWIKESKEFFKRFSKSYLKKQFTKPFKKFSKKLQRLFCKFSRKSLKFFLKHSEQKSNFLGFKKFFKNFPKKFEKRISVKSFSILVWKKIEFVTCKNNILFFLIFENYYLEYKIFEDWSNTISIWSFFANFKGL